MKIIRHAILLFFLIAVGCESPEMIHGVYIFKYGTSKIQNSELLNNYSLPVLTCFTEDSVGFISFEMDQAFLGSESSTEYYTQTDSTITIFGNDKQEVLGISHKSRDSLILTKEQDPEYKRVLIPLTRYGQKSEELNIRNGFRKNGFKWNSIADVIEFDSAGYFSWTEAPTASIYRKKWALKSYEDELFLTLLDGKTQLIHIKEYKDEILIGIVYSEFDQLIQLKPVEVGPTFNSEDLIGEWEEILGEDMPLPPIVNLENYQLREMLNFDEQKLIRRKYTDSDTLKWFSNQFNNKVIVDQGIRSLGDQWNVLELKEDQLTIKRYDGFGTRSQNNFETVKFRRRK